MLNFLKANDIEYKLYEHPALYTVEECLAYWGNIPDVTHCKNLFFRNHKGNRHYLVSMECHKLLDIHSLEHMLRQGKLSFASEERMVRCLGLHPGSVSAFGLIEDIDPKDADPKELFPDGHRVKYYIDSALRDADRVSFILARTRRAWSSPMPVSGGSCRSGAARSNGWMCRHIHQRII